MIKLLSRSLSLTVSLSPPPSNSQRGDKNHFRSLLFNMEDVLSWRRKLLHSNVTHVRIIKFSLITAVCPLGLFFTETSPNFCLILGFLFSCQFSPQDAVQDMRTRLSYKIDSVNNEFHCPLTPRDNKGEIINCHECSAQQLYHVVSSNM